MRSGKLQSGLDTSRMETRSIKDPYHSWFWFLKIKIKSLWWASGQAREGSAQLKKTAWFGLKSARSVRSCLASIHRAFRNVRRGFSLPASPVWVKNSVSAKKKSQLFWRSLALSQLRMRLSMSLLSLEYKPQKQRSWAPHHSWFWLLKIKIKSADGLTPECLRVHLLFILKIMVRASPILVLIFENQQE